MRCVSVFNFLKSVFNALFFFPKFVFLCSIHSSTRTLYSRVSGCDVLVVLQLLQLSAAVDGGAGELFWI